MRGGAKTCNVNLAFEGKITVGTKEARVDPRGGGVGTGNIELDGCGERLEQGRRSSARMPCLSTKVGKLAAPACCCCIAVCGKKKRQSAV